MKSSAAAKASPWFACCLLLLVPWLSASEPGTVRLLTIGNSFADNALTFLPDLVKASGHSLILGRANLGGCSLERHWRHVSEHEADPDGKAGSPYAGGTASLHQLLTKDRWDVITIQQVSLLSHDPATYVPYGGNLVRYIRERAPQAQILVHQIWAYRVDDSRFTQKSAAGTPRTQREMYGQLRAACHALSKEFKLGILPSGDAMFLADADPEWGYRVDQAFDFAAAKFPALPDQSHSLHAGWAWKSSGEAHSLALDGHHASPAGKYLLGCVWFESLFGESLVGNPFVPAGLDGDHAAFLRQTAHRAVQDLRAETAAQHRAPAAPVR